MPITQGLPEPPKYVNKAFAKKVYFSILLITFVWCILILIAPLLIGMGGVFTKFAGIIYVFFSKACHQEDIRSFHLFGNKLAVCSRCSAIYFAFFLGVAAYPLMRKLNTIRLPALWLLLAASALMLLDVIFEVSGVMDNTFLSRSLTGGFLGFVLPLYLIPGFLNFFTEIAVYLNNKNIKIYEQTP